MRPPRGKATTEAAVRPLAVFPVDSWADVAPVAMVQFARMLSPRCGLIRFGISLERRWRSWRNRSAVVNWSLYGDLINSSAPFWFAASSSWGLRERSEEHTSELQSRGHLVCRLLLEKKKKQQYQYNIHFITHVFIDII